MVHHVDAIALGTGLLDTELLQMKRITVISYFISLYAVNQITHYVQTYVTVYKIEFVRMV